MPAVLDTTGHVLDLGRGQAAAHRTPTPRADRGAEDVPSSRAAPCRGRSATPTTAPPGRPAATPAPATRSCCAPSTTTRPTPTTSTTHCGRRPSVGACPQPSPRGCPACRGSGTFGATSFLGRHHSMSPRRLSTLLVAGLVVLGPLSGCSDDDPEPIIASTAPSPTPTAPASPTDTPSAEPEPETAKAFIRRWQEDVFADAGLGIRTNTSNFETDPTVRSVRAFADQCDEIYASGRINPGRDRTCPQTSKESAKSTKPC